MKNFIRITTITFSLIALWQLAIYFLQLPPYILPSPFAVLQSLYQFAPQIFINAVPTIIEALLGFGLSIIIGCIGALSLIYFRPARLWFLPLLLICQALPTFAIAPLLVMWLGYGIASKVVTTILMIFFPITSAFYDGLSRTFSGYLDLAQTMNATPQQILLRLRIPAALPSLGSGLRLAASFAPMGAVIGEWVGASKGLGFLILNANSRMQIDLMFAALLVLIIFTLVFYFAIDFLIKYLTPWTNKYD